MTPTGREGNMGTTKGLAGTGRMLRIMTMLAFVGGLVLNARPAAAQEAGSTVIVSMGYDGTPANGQSEDSVISKYGEYVAFRSMASHLVEGDTNETWDVFVRDMRSGVTERISAASDGTEGNAESYLPAITLNGRYVAFTSLASNLSPDDANGALDIFLRDRELGVTQRITLAQDQKGAPELLSANPTISDDGRYVAYLSSVGDLVTGDTNDTLDVFVYDRETDQTVCASVNSDGSQSNNASYLPHLSADGRSVAFSSHASNLVAGDGNGRRDVFVHDLQSGETERVSVASDATEWNVGSNYPSLSADGRYVAFSSGTGGMGSGWVHDRESGATTLISSTGDGPNISGDGRYVVFYDYRVESAEADVFFHDRQTGQTSMVSASSTGELADGYSGFPAISGNGRYVSFGSMATNLVSGDTNGYFDVFVREMDIPAAFEGCSGVTDVTQAECEALIAFYSSTAGPTWINSTGWLETNSVCSWYGVTCTAGHVTGLVLESNGLSGILPTAQWAALPSLQVLDL